MFSLLIAFGPPHGLLSMALLAASPFYIAHAVNNPKDLPFATVTTAVLLALTRLRKTLPVLNWTNALTLAGLSKLKLGVLEKYESVLMGILLCAVGILIILFET